jgi:hypothetical protein
VACEQRSQGPTLGVSERQEPSHLAPGREGPPAFSATGGVPTPVCPARFRRHPPEFGVDAAEQRMQGRVGGTFLGRELQVERNGVEAREEPSGEVGDGEFEDGRADQLREPVHDGGVARRRCREPQSSMRGHHLEGLVAEAGPEVMDLINDEEVEPVTEVSHVPIRALKCGHRQGSELARPVPVAPNGAPVHGADFARPLIEQDARRYQAERAEPGSADRGDGQPSLAASRREDDDASVLRQFPGRESSLLVGPEVDDRPRVRGQPRQGRDAFELDAGLSESPAEGGVSAGWRAMDPYARVPQDARRLGEVHVLGRVGE